MSVILYLPALLVILFKRHGTIHTSVHAVVMVAVQFLIGQDFLRSHPREYLVQAFDLSRVFLYKWTVNWRFVPEDVFLGKQFATTLLIGHVGCLVAFALFKWCRTEGGVFALLERGLRRPNEKPSMHQALSSDRTLTMRYIIAQAYQILLDVITLMMTSNLIGIVFARSLHYQFYSWYAQQLPLLAWRTRLPVPIRYASSLFSRRLTTR